MADTRAELHRQIAETTAEGYRTVKHTYQGCIFRGPYQVDKNGNILHGKPGEGEAVGPALFKLVACHPHPGPGIWMEGVNTEYSPCISGRALGRTFHHVYDCPCWKD